MSTFFARDIRALVEAGIEADVFAIYPPAERLWKYVPGWLSEDLLPRSRVFHIRMQDCLAASVAAPRMAVDCARLFTPVARSAAEFGALPLLKSAYSAIKAFAWAARNRVRYDHVLAYWGNYAGTCAYLFRALAAPESPYSCFLHAGTDLYRDQVFLLEKLLVARHIMVVCDFNRRFLRDLYPAAYPILKPRIQVYHLGLDLDEYDFEPWERLPGTILAVGRLERMKGFEFLIRALPLLAAGQGHARLEIIGEGPEERKLRRLCRGLGVESRIVFRGWLRPEEVREAMKRSAILAHPSAGLGDAVPTVIKECMALGTPVVASDVAGIPELLGGGECGMLTAPEDPVSLAEAISPLLASDELRLHYAHAARKRAEALFDGRKNGRALSALLLEGAASQAAATIH